jgi:Asp-tRNA(Asn)/Glu-tRNA(Gln) amidotransferase A subunit family amidase
MTTTPQPFDTNRDVPHDEPQDLGIDRRAFLARFAAVTAAAAGGSLAATWAKPAHAITRSVWVDPYKDSVRPEALGDLTELTAAEASFLIRARKLRPIDLVDAYLDRIERFDGIYQAFNTVVADAARAAALAAEGAPARGSLHGIPLAIKDNFYTTGVLTTANSFIYETFVPTFDATTVAKLFAAGGILLGKTQMGPLATTRATTPDGVVTTVNAWTPNDPSVNPGGSSSGSGCAVAARLASSSTGTQTGGSITAPSNAQNLTGLKPTMGRCSLYGIIPLSYTRDHPGPLARDVKDAALMLEIMAGPDANDPRSLGLPKVPRLTAAATPVRFKGRVALRWPTRIGVIPGYTSGGTPTAALRLAMLDAFADLGAEIVDVTLPAEWDLLTGTAFNNVRLPERTEPFLEFLKQDLKLFGVSLNGWMQGLFLSADEFLKGQRAKYRLLARILDDLYAQCDVVVQTSPVPFDIVGLPEIAFPIGFAPNNAGITVPAGAILGGKPFGEDRLCALVAAYQAVTDFHLERPPDPVVTLATRRAAVAPLRLSAEDVEASMQ